MKLTRKDFLSSLGGLAAGLPLGAFGRPALSSEPATNRPVESGAETAPVDAPEDQSAVSYAQSGEDIIVDYVCKNLGIEPSSYLDIGAYDPIIINNTYYFYKKGGRGVLVEPNIVACERLREVRPRDTTLAAGIGTEAVGEADYYVMTEPSWNTFSREEAEHQVGATGGKVAIRQVVKVPLLDVNAVMAEHFQGAPKFLSIDAEGLHFAILKSIDFGRFRPEVICIETLVSGSHATIPEIPAFLHSRGYVQRGGTFVNGIFVDGALIKESA